MVEMLPATSMDPRLHGGDGNGGHASRTNIVIPAKAETHGTSPHASAHGGWGLRKFPLAARAGVTPK
jgi:hypothetical protein